MFDYTLIIDDTLMKVLLSCNEQVGNDVELNEFIVNFATREQGSMRGYGYCIADQSFIEKPR